MKAFLQRKNIVFSAKRYGIDALGAMAQGLFCTLLVGTILNTLGQQLGIGFLNEIIVTVGGSEAIDIAMRSIVDPGDEVIVPAYTYIATAMAVVAAGAIPIIAEVSKVLGRDAIFLGMDLPDARIHSPNENMRVDIFEKGISMAENLLRLMAGA